jgi:hypothetical protein
MPTITVRIARDGTVHAETHGLKGEACLPYVAALERLVDAETVRSEYTAEFHEQATTEQTQSQVLDVDW